MNWLDGVLLLALVWSALTGVRRGLTFELLSLASWLAALLAAHVFGELVGMLLPWSMPAAVQYAVGFVIVLLGVRLVLVALALGLKALVQDSVLGGVDRGLGGLFGMARGVLLLGLLALGVTLTPLRDEPVWKASVAAAWLTEGVQAARDAFHEFSGKCALRIGMGCEARATAMAVAIARTSNEADRPSPQMHTSLRFVKSIPRPWISPHLQSLWPKEAPGGRGAGFVFV